MSSGGAIDVVESERQVARARERFVAGDDHITGVHPDIVRSWYRCREQYRVDPNLCEAPIAPARSERPSRYDSMFAELGGSAVSVLHEVENLDCVVTVSDGTGRIMAVWGDRATLDRARESNMAPLAYWAEGASGTNGIGTALETSGPVLVRGAEHWCHGFQNWVCAGISVRDAVTGEPAAVLNISRWQTSLPDAVTTWLSEGVVAAKADLRRGAREAGAELVATFDRAQPPASGGLVAVDRGGKVVLADDQASVYLDVPGCSPELDPVARWEAGLTDVALMASVNGQRDPSWVGVSEIATYVTGEPIPVTVRPVFASREVIGALVFFDADEHGEPAVTGPERYDRHPCRIVATRGQRLVLLRPAEVSIAEADGNKVWLSTDGGRMQGAIQSLDKLEGEFVSSGFLRVHRRFVVNLNRVREVERGFKGELFLIMDTRGRESVTVSRRNSALVRRALGI